MPASLAPPTRTADNRGSLGLFFAVVKFTGNYSELEIFGGCAAGHARFSPAAAMHG